MKIEDRGYVLTDVPGLGQIVIEPDESSASGVHILLFRDGEAQSYGVAELGELIPALERAYQLAHVVIQGLREAQRPDALQ